jgi:alkanesulfonate monooxygenase SsuD/methylene tetrahydromethanopterin reductase-like flavin-dependent oxidoreductase (luciferase family)
VEAGRDPARIGMEGRVSWRGSPEELAEQVAAWRDAGATHVSINTMGAGLGAVDNHLSVLETAAGIMKPLGE